MDELLTRAPGTNDAKCDRLGVRERGRTSMLSVHTDGAGGYVASITIGVRK